MIVENGIWDGILESIKNKLSNETFETWFSLIEFRGVDYESSSIQLRAPNEVVRAWVTTNFTSLLGEALSELNLAGYSVQWVLDPDGVKADSSNSAECHLPPRVGLPVALSATKTEEPPVPAFFSSPRSADYQSLDPSLNSKYSYEGFVVGSCNQFAHAASLAVAALLIADRATSTAMAT